MTERKRIAIWTLYDFANTSFAIIVVTFLYAVYFRKVVAGDESVGDLYWSIATSASMAVTGLIAPILGAIADHSAGKKRFLLFFTLNCIIATGLLYFVGPGDVILGILLLIFANIGFEAGLIFYDAFLPEITSPKNYGRVSGYGFAAGYLGSLTSLAIVFPFIQNELIRESFPVAAAFFLIFSLPLFLFLKDTRKEVTRTESFIKIGFNRVRHTLKHLKYRKNLAWFLLSYFVYIEGVNTVIYFAGIYASTTLGFSQTELIIFFITVQSTAIVGSILLGVISDRIGQKRTIVISLIIWIVTVILAFFVKGKQEFYLVGLLAGAAMGSSQSTSRSLMSKLTPPDHKTEFFGFYSFFGKSSAVIGPLVFGVISYLTGSQRYAILSLLVFFVVGILLIQKVEDAYPETEKGSDQTEPV